MQRNPTHTEDRDEDKALIDALVAGDPTAIDRFYRRYQALIWSTARRTVRDDWDAEEVVQDVIWTVYRKADSFRADSSLSTWVYRITVNAGRMLLRKRKRIPTPLADDVMERTIGMHEFGNCATMPDAVAAGAAAARNFNAALLELEPEARDLFIAIDLDCEDRAEVAARLDVSIPALKARLHRVRKHLRASTAPLELAAA